MTTQDDIIQWFHRGEEQGATHMIVVCDTFDYEDFPVFIKPGEDVKERENYYNSPTRMSRVMEVYNLDKPMMPQILKDRNFVY